MKKLARLILAAALVAFLAPALAALLTSCAGPSPWLKPQGELVQLERQAAGALKLASDPRTRAALQLCVTAAQGAAHAIDDLLREQEKLRLAKREGAAIPELERSVARATSDAGDAEAQARADCKRAGVTPTAVRAPAAADGGAPVDGGAAADLGSVPAAAPVRVAPASDLPPAAVDGGAR